MIAILLIHILTTLMMTGIIWFVQLVHYPLLSRVSLDEMVAYSRLHQQWTGFLVIPLMVLEMLTGAFLAFFTFFSPAWIYFAIGFALLMIIWISTVLWQARIHRQLAQNPTREAVHSLVWSNWLRTAAWTLRTIVLLTLLGEVLPTGIL